MAQELESNGSALPAGASGDQPLLRREAELEQIQCHGPDP